jgi:hypothetical protein
MFKENVADVEPESIFALASNETVLILVLSRLPAKKPKASLLVAASDIAVSDIAEKPSIIQVLHLM